MERGCSPINMKNKIVIISLVAIVAFSGVWVYFTKHPLVSYQFQGTVLEVRTDNLAMIGDYIKLGEKKSVTTGSKVVTVFFSDNTKIIRNSIEVKKDAGLKELSGPVVQTQKTVSATELKRDLQDKNLVLTVNSGSNIYRLDVFTATNIEYTVLVIK